MLTPTPNVIAARDLGSLEPERRQALIEAFKRKGYTLASSYSPIDDVVAMVAFTGDAAAAATDWLTGATSDFTDEAPDALAAAVTAFVEDERDQRRSRRTEAT